MLRQDRVVFGGDWVRLTSADVDTFRCPRARVAFFAQFPDGVLVRPLQQHGEDRVPFKALCSKTGCRNTLPMRSCMKANHCFCEQHSRRVFNGITVKAMHLLENFDRIVAVKTKATGDRHGWYAACENVGCRKLVNISRKKDVHHTQCAHCRLIQKRVEFLCENTSHADGIVAWSVNRNNGRYLRYPMMRCKAKNCPSLLKFTPTRMKEKDALCRHCAGKIVRKLPFESRYNLLRVAAFERKIKFTLTLAQYTQMLLPNKCHYCESVLNAKPFLSSGSDRKRASALDRKDNSLGYTAENCVPCCATCNLTKARFVSYDEMLILGALRKGSVADAMSLCSAVMPKIVNHLQMLAQTKNLMTKKTRTE